MLAPPQRMRQPIPQIIRVAVLRNMRSMLSTSCEVKIWYHAVCVLDMCTRCLSADHFTRDLPLTSIAICRWVQSAECVLARKPLDDCIRYVSAMAHWLYSTGHVAEAPPNMTGEEFRVAEKDLFLRLNGICFRPSSHEWLRVLFTRIQVLTQKTYDACLRLAWKRCHILLFMVTLVLDTTDVRFPPSRKATRLADAQPCGFAPAAYGDAAATLGNRRGLADAFYQQSA